ncbi:armadillo-type protein [Mortierella sp. GBAus27b]|nr:armadillo-type protein [Mortierella sp. GBAus27b]
MALDSNAVAQESGLGTLIQFVENAPEPNRTKSTVVPAVVEKCLSSTRAGTKAKALELILLYVEVDTPDPVIEDVLPGLEAKLPKLVATTTNTLAAIVRTFGVKNMNVKPIIKKLAPLFSHSDKNVRAEANALTIELYRWIGKAIMPSLEDLKPVQQKELTEAFEKLPSEKPTPVKYLRSQQAAMAAAAAAAAEAGDEDAEGEAKDEEDEDMVVVDELDLIDPVDISAKMEKNFYELLASKKWQERKEALDGLLTLCKSPKILDSNYSELASSLGKRMADTNINIVIVAANCIEGLARGLRDNFNKYKSSVSGLIMDRLKERKVTVVEALTGALNAIYSTLPYSDLLEDTAANVAHKNPQIRAEVIKLQTSRLKEIKIAPSKQEIKTACELLVKSFDDGDAAVREATAEALGTLMKCCGEKPLLVFLENLDTVKMGKVKEYFEKAVVKAKPAPVAAPPKPAAKAPPAKPGAKKPAAAAPAAEAPAKKPPAKAAPAAAAAAAPAKKPPAKAAPAAAAGAAKKAAPGGGAKKEEEPLRYKYSSEAAEELAADFLTPELIAQFGDSAWKVRLEAMEKLHELVDSNPEFEAELITRVLAKKPGWKESNFQVTTKMYGIFQLQAQKLSSFSKGCAALTIPAMIDKMGDVKLKKAAGDCLTTYAESLSLQFVLSQSYDPLKKLKAPKALADSLQWINQQLEDFGISGLQVREMIDFLKVALGSANAAVRTNAVTVLGTLRRFIGPGIRSFVEDCNTALLSAIDAEFTRVADMDPPEVTKGPVVESSSGGAGGAAASAAVEELFPKVDIGNLFTSAMLEECGDANWKVRKEGLEKVAAIIDANKRIKPNLGSLPGALKLRLADSNKNLQIQTMEICASLANAMGKPFEKYSRMICSNVASCLTDQKDNVRNASIAALEAFAMQGGLDALVSSLATSLVTNSPTLRKDLLVWLTSFCTKAKERDATIPDLSPLAPPTLQCLQDRSVDVRKAAQGFLPVLVGSMGYDAVVAKCGDLKGAAKSSIMPMIEAAKPPPPPKPPVVDTSKAEQAERGALNTLPRLPKSNANGAARPGSAAAAAPPSAPSKPAARPAASAPPAAAPPSREQQSSPIPTIPALPALPATGPRALKKPGQTIPSAMDHEMHDDYSTPAVNNPPAPMGMGMSRGAFDPMEGINPTSQPLNGSRPMGVNNMGGMGGGLSLNNGSHPSIGPLSAQTKRLSVSPGVQMDYIVSQITSDDATQSIDALKQLEKAIAGQLDVVIPHVNELVNAHTLQIRLAYTGLEQRNQSTTRVCKHLVNSLVGIFSNKQLAMKVQSDPLYNLLHELATRLLDENLGKVESGQQLAKALNVTMVKVLENSNRNATFSALLLILVRCAQPLRNNEDSAHQAKFGDLIMKCIWKLTKAIKECVASGALKANELLADMNDFLVSIPPPEWKRRAQEGVPMGDMPLRTVKTVLVELSSGMGDEIFNHLDLIHEPTKSAIHHLLVHMTGTKKRPAAAQPQNPSPQPIMGNPVQNRMSVVGPMTSQNLSAHNMLQQQQQQQQQQQFTSMTPTSPQFQHTSQFSHPSQFSHSPQFQHQPQFPHSAPFQQPSLTTQPVLPRTPLQSTFGSQIPGHPTSVPGYGMQQPPQNDFGGSGANPDRMSMSMRQSPSPTPNLNGNDAGKSTGEVSEAEMNARLNQIFTKIGTREETKQGISDLYQFQKMYPNMEPKVNAQLAKTGTFFQSYIRRGLANLEAEANAAATGGAVPTMSSTLGPAGLGLAASRTLGVDDASRKRESVISMTGSDSGASTLGGNDPSESYKERLSRLQQMFNIKSATSPVHDGPDTGNRLMEGRSSPALGLPQSNDFQQQSLARSRPSSLYQPSGTSAAPSPTAAHFGGSMSAMHSPYQSHFNQQDTGFNNGFTGSNGSFSPATTGPSPLQAFQESMAAKERAQTVAMMKERLARMKSQTMTTSQMALQQLQQGDPGSSSGHPSGHPGGNGQFY